MATGRAHKAEKAQPLCVSSVPGVPTPVAMLQIRNDAFCLWVDRQPEVETDDESVVAHKRFSLRLRPG